MIGYVKRHWELYAGIVGTALVVLIIFVSFCYATVGSHTDLVFRSQKDLTHAMGGAKPVGIVFGGGIEGGKPRPLLRDRLDAAAGLLQAGIVSKLIVTGDNRTHSYNEPQAMHDYLVKEKGIDEEVIQLDNAGRSTYESCERASKVFKLKQAVLISESTHLPRAIYLCRHFDIASYGYASDGKAANNLQLSQNIREVMARTKAILNIYVVGEKTVLGDPIPVR